ncbi:PA14 domain-containing protein [Thermococcus paralvinellae]|uniref:PA14 domain-containing protein n=1 Tax=Thermococcus paralvinellae TaxID=582419 RepID=W0I162_9EURY|nr:hypothetical protein [Thermococcus paralvinellae]AHF79749.1 Hypothetical protein TES1_0355 [Thermococcus paralvinellae]
MRKLIIIVLVIILAPLFQFASGSVPNKILLIRYEGEDMYTTNPFEWSTTFKCSRPLEVTYVDSISFRGNWREDYTAYYEVTMEVLKEGFWQFAIDSDDASDLIIDGKIVVSWYGGHGFCNCQDHRGTIYLTKGNHTLIVRMQEKTGGDGVVLYFKSPSDSEWRVFSAQNLIGKAKLYAKSNVDTTSTCQNAVRITQFYIPDREGILGVLYVRFSSRSPKYVNLPSEWSDFFDCNNIIESGILNGFVMSFGNRGEEYTTYLEAILEVDKEGVWYFAIDGDDAVDLIIDGKIVADWYGGHAPCYCQEHTGIVYLTKGNHTVIVRHQEYTGVDGVVVYFKAPGDTEWKKLTIDNLQGKGKLYVPVRDEDYLRSCTFTQIITTYLPPRGLLVPGILLVEYAGKQSGYAYGPDEWEEHYNCGEIKRIRIVDRIYWYNWIENNVSFHYEALLNVKIPGEYRFAIDGDDAVDVVLDGKIIAHWYGGHAPHRGTPDTWQIKDKEISDKIHLSEGWHTLMVRHQEYTGIEAVILYIQFPMRDDWVLFSLDNVKEYMDVYAYVPDDNTLRSCMFVRGEPLITPEATTTPTKAPISWKVLLISAILIISLTIKRR